MNFNGEILVFKRKIFIAYLWHTYALELEERQ